MGRPGVKVLMTFPFNLNFSSMLISRALISTTNPPLRVTYIIVIYARVQLFRHCVYFAVDICHYCQA